MGNGLTSGSRTFALTSEVEVNIGQPLAEAPTFEVGPIREQDDGQLPGRIPRDVGAKSQPSPGMAQALDPPVAIDHPAKTVVQKPTVGQSAAGESLLQGITGDKSVRIEGLIPEEEIGGARKDAPGTDDSIEQMLAIRHHPTPQRAIASGRTSTDGLPQAKDKRIPHAQGLKDPLLDKIGERTTRDPGNHHRQQIVAGVAISEALTGDEIGPHLAQYLKTLAVVG